MLMFPVYNLAINDRYAVGVNFDQPTTEHALFHIFRPVSATEPFLLLDLKSGTICHWNCDTWF